MIICILLRLIIFCNFKSDIVRSKDIFETNCVLKYENLTVKVKGKKGKMKGKKGRRIRTLATKIGKRIITNIKPLKKTYRSLVLVKTRHYKSLDEKSMKGAGQSA